VEENHPVSKEVGILILRPKITYEDIETEQELPSADHGGAEISQFLEETSKNVLKEKGFHVIEAREIREHAGAKPPITETLSDMSDKLVRPKLQESARSLLKELPNSEYQVAVFAQFLRVKVGPGAYRSWVWGWGEVLPSTTTSHLRAVLIDPRSSQVLWHNETFFRDTPAIQSNLMKEAIELLYQTLEAEEGETNG
jgi:hypothetical protein